ncbi:MAG: F0F1 ATP synthase subunit B [Chromatiales bacterium]
MEINITLLGQMITFGLLVWFTMKKVWPPLLNAMQERQKRIADGLAAAERGKKEQELAESKIQDQLREAKQQAADIIAQAQKRGNEIVEEAKEAARSEGDRIKAAAGAEIEQEVNRAKEKLRAQVATIAVEGAERILKKEIDPKAHSQVLDDLVAQI